MNMYLNSNWKHSSISFVIMSFTYIYLVYTIIQCSKSGCTCLSDSVVNIGHQLLNVIRLYDKGESIQMFNTILNDIILNWHVKRISYLANMFVYFTFSL